MHAHEITEYIKNKQTVVKKYAVTIEKNGLRKTGESLWYVAYTKSTREKYNMRLEMWQSPPCLNARAVQLPGEPVGKGAGREGLQR